MATIRPSKSYQNPFINNALRGHSWKRRTGDDLAPFLSLERGHPVGGLRRMKMLTMLGEQGKIQVISHLHEELPAGFSGMTNRFSVTSSTAATIRIPISPRADLSGIIQKWCRLYNRPVRVITLEFFGGNSNRLLPESRLRASNPYPTHPALAGRAGKDRVGFSHQDEEPHTAKLYFLFPFVVTVQGSIQRW